MEVSEGVSQQDRLQLLAEKRKRQTEVENKKRQLEDDKRQLQHLKSKALRERWLLDGAPAGQPEQDDVRRQLTEDENKTRDLENTISRLEQELADLESAVCVSVTHSKDKTEDQHIIVTSSSSVKAVEVRPAVEVKAERRVSRPISSGKEAGPMMRAAVYSVEIKVEKDKNTGETKVLSSSTLLPVDLSLQGVKVYEDHQKVVHEMNGEDGGVQLSSSEVEDMILKADQVSSTVTVTTQQTLETVDEQASLELTGPEAVESAAGGTDLEAASSISGLEAVSGITGLESAAGVTADGAGDPVLGDASAEQPVTMVFLGYQSVEDELETKRVLGVDEGTTVQAELVLIQDEAPPPSDGSHDPASDTHPASDTTTAAAVTTTQPLSAGKLPPPQGEEEAETKKKSHAHAATPAAEVDAAGKGGEQEGGGASGEKDVGGDKDGGEGGGDNGGGVSSSQEVSSKEKQPCKCCSIM